MNYADFTRSITKPHWCEGDPLRWTTPENIGIAHIAATGNVGVFNISWWLLGRREPPLTAKVYRNTNILWAITVSPYIMTGGFSLAHYAAMKTRVEFDALLLSRELSLKDKVEKQGMTWDTLRMLATRGQFA